MLKIFIKKNRYNINKPFNFFLSCHYTIILAALSLLSILIFSFSNTHEQLSDNEALNMYVTDLHFNEMIRFITDNDLLTNPPFYHIILKSIKFFLGDSVLIARCLSGLFGVFFIIAFYLFVNKIFSKPVALISSSILIFNPIIIQYSQDISMYMLAALLFCISQFSFFIAVKENKTVYWIVHTLSCISGIYTHYYLIFPIAANFIFYFIVNVLSKDKSGVRSGSIIFYFLSQVIVLLAYIPWIPVLRLQLELISKSLLTEPIGNDIALRVLSFFFTTKYSLDVNQFIPFQTLSMISIFFISLLLYHIAKNRNFEDKDLFVFTSVFIPMAIVFTFSATRYSIINFRNFIPYFPFFTILLTSGIFLIRKKMTILIIASLYISANIPTIYTIYNTNFNGSAYETAEYLKKISCTDNPIIVFDKSTFMTLLYYLKQPPNLFYYSNEKPASHSFINTSFNHLLNDDKFLQLQSGINSFYTVLTPETKEYPENYLKFTDFNFLQDSKFEKRFIFENSWFRTKVVKYFKTNINIF